MEEPGWTGGATERKKAVEKRTKERQLSPSVQIILEQLQRLGLNKADFARQLGVSQDYVYRILNGRIPFPHARETIERMAEVVQLAPHAFSEYRELDGALSTSARLIWQRMRELGISREDLYQAMSGRISRPYYNSILRGDQPFPTNRAFIQMFALALELPPTAFAEFGPKQAPRWSDRDLAEMEERTFQFFFDKMMADRGYARQPMPFRLLDPARALAFFLPESQLPEGLVEVLCRMGELGMGYRELERISGLPPERLRALFTVAGPPAGARCDIEAIRDALRIEQESR